MEKRRKPPVLEFWLTGEQWVQFTRVMELCHRLRGGPVGPADCLELLCRTYIERSTGQGADFEGGEGIRRRRSFL
jgi:hypothetical protein